MSDAVQLAIQSFHAHLDECEQCRENPFGLCSKGKELLLGFGRTAGVVFLIAQNDDPELLEWLANARERGGHFVSSLAKAALVADWENYPLIRPVILQMRAKYPDYEPSEAVKREIRERR